MEINLNNRFKMAINNGTPKVQNDIYAYNFSDSKVKALNTTNGNIIIIKNKVKNKKRVYINDIIKG